MNGNKLVMPKAWLMKVPIPLDGKDFSEWGKAERCKCLGKDESIVYIDGMAFKMWDEIHKKSNKVSIFGFISFEHEVSTPPCLKAICSIHRSH